MSSVPAAKPWAKYATGKPGDPVTYAFLERNTSTWQYLVACPSTSDAVLIDTVLDYHPETSTVSHETADGILSFIDENKFKVTRILETHAHADHLTSAQYLHERIPSHPPICIGQKISQVQKTFSNRYGFNDATDFKNTFDDFLQDGDKFSIGELTCNVILLAGHTPDHLGYQVGTSIFTGDSIFMPDLGSARADFPGGSASDLYKSLKRVLSYPDDYQIFVGHDYPSGDRDFGCVATVAEHKKNNKHAKEGVAEDEFIQMRQSRDKNLAAPRYLHPSLQVNIRAGLLPPQDESGKVAFVTPV